MTQEEYTLKSQEIDLLVAKLTSNTSDLGDWKIIKYQEQMAASGSSDIDIQALHVERQKVRDRINALQEELKKA